MARILIADDEHDVGMIVTERLRRNGHEVAYAEDGDQAIASVEAKAYDLLILDIHMPGYTGYQVCLHAKGSSKNAATPVLLISAFPEERSKWQQSKADAFLAKPFETGKLMLAVEALLKTTGGTA